MAAPKKQRGLGRGLDALFGTSEVNYRVSKENAQGKNVKKTQSSLTDKEEKAKTGIEYIDINDIKPNSQQPRKTFDAEKLEELAASIREHGLIQPLVLRKAKRGYEIVAGERRWRAARMAGVKEIPAIVKELTDEENMLLAIIENMQREDLNPIEEAEGISQMVSAYGFTQEQISRSVGKSRPYIANSLRLLKLSAPVKEYVTSGALTAGHARALAAIGDEERQISLARLAVQKGFTVRQTEDLVGDSKGSQKRTKAKRRAAAKSADVKRVETELKELLGTKVNINRKGTRGNIEIAFYSKEELERLIDLLKTLH